VSAIVHDLTTAQDLANEYSSQLSQKYKKLENEKDNILSNFKVPSGKLHAIEIDLKFAVQTLETNSSRLDIEKSQENCSKVADEVAKLTIESLESFTSDILINSPTLLATVQASTISPLVSPPTSNQEQEKKKILDNWQSIKNNILDPQYAEFIQTTIFEALFEQVKRFHLRGTSPNEADVRENIVQQLEYCTIEHEDIQEILENTQKAFNRNKEEIRSHLRGLFDNIVQTVVTSKTTQELIAFMPGVYDANIVVNPTELKELPIEMVSSIKISAALDNYRWIIDEKSQSLQKVED
jgi:hypothetical protein